MPGLPTSYIEPDVLKEADQISENTLQVPDGAETSGIPGQKGYRASWPETFDITSVETNPSEKGNGWIVTKLMMNVAPDVESVNAGRPVLQTILTFPEAHGDKKHKYYNLHMKGLSKMGNLLRALGLIEEDSGFSPAEFFDNPESQVIASRVAGTVTRFTKRNGDTETDIGHFTAAV